MFYLLAGVPLLAVVVFGLVYKWRQFGAAEERLSKARAAQKERYSRSRSGLDDNGRKEPANRPRVFGRR
ncbi:MAG: hypothetical protein ACR2PM_18265 [Hyphomicrobiales bacterium]